MQCRMVEGTETLNLKDNGQIRDVLASHAPCQVMSLQNVCLHNRGYAQLPNKLILRHMLMIISFPYLKIYVILVIVLTVPVRHNHYLSKRK